MVFWAAAVRVVLVLLLAGLAVVLAEVLFAVEDGLAAVAFVSLVSMS